MANSCEEHDNAAAEQRNLIAGRRVDAYGPGVPYAKAFASRLGEHGVSGAGIVRPLIDDLARAAMPAFDKATAARVACNAQGRPDWGAGPMVAMPNGDLIVTPRMVAQEGPVLIVKPDGAVLRGTGRIDMRDETTTSSRT